MRRVGVLVLLALPVAAGVPGIALAEHAADGTPTAVWTVPGDTAAESDLNPLSDVLLDDGDEDDEDDEEDEGEEEDEEDEKEREYEDEHEEEDGRHGNNEPNGDNGRNGNNGNENNGNGQQGAAGQDDRGDDEADDGEAEGEEGEVDETAEDETDESDGDNEDGAVGDETSGDDGADDSNDAGGAVDSDEGGLDAGDVPTSLPSSVNRSTSAPVTTPAGEATFSVPMATLGKTSVATGENVRIRLRVENTGEREGRAETRTDGAAEGTDLWAEFGVAVFVGVLLSAGALGLGKG